MGGCLSTSARVQPMTDRGGAVHQDKSWVRVVTGHPMRFIHCGGFPKTITRLSIAFSKEIISIPGNAHAPTKFVLAYPVAHQKLAEADGTIAAPADNTQMGKSIAQLWSAVECPHAVIFDVPFGTECYVESRINPQGNVEPVPFNPVSQVAFPNDIVFAEGAVWHYTRVGGGRSIAKDVSDFPTFG